MLIICFVLLAKSYPQLLSAQEVIKIQEDILKVYAYNDDVALLEHDMNSVYGKEITELTIDLSSLHFLAYVEVQYETDNKPFSSAIVQYYDFSGKQSRICEPHLSSTTYQCDKMSRIFEIKGEKTKLLKVNIFGYAIKATRFVGCYSTTNLDVSKITETLDQCESDCQAFPFHGYNMDKFCHCVQDLTLLLPVTSSLCWNHCPNRKFQLCGTPETLAVYKGEAGEVNRTYTTIECIKSLNCPSCESGMIGFNCETRDCSTNDGNCEDMNCEKIYSSYSICVCFHGYTFDNNMFCQDLDECIFQSSCTDPNSACINSIGSYHCQCKAGFTDEGGTTCTDIDECLSPVTCEPSTSTCKNLDGTYECLCIAGYTKGPDRPTEEACEDVDECTDAETCSNGYCINQPGTFTCKCYEGFHDINDSICVDINECELPAICDQTSTTCNNLEGQYECFCKTGFIRNRGESRKIGCQDFDECQSIMYGCPDDVPCINSPGSYNCICPNGTIKREYIYSIECEDIDECLSIKVCEDDKSFCLNLFNSYTCLCKPGYANVDFFTCVEKDVNYTTTTDVTSTTTERQPYDIIILFIIKIVQLALGFLLIVIIGSGSIYVIYKKAMIHSTSYPASQSADSKLKVGKI